MARVWNEFGVVACRQCIDSCALLDRTNRTYETQAHGFAPFCHRCGAAQWLRVVRGEESLRRWSHRDEGGRTGIRRRHGVESQDLAAVTDKMARGLIGLPQIANAATPPRIVLDPVVNDTRFAITKTFSDAHARVAELEGAG
jgi:hypothetical protein